jgi:hypothetical protein
MTISQSQAIAKLRAMLFRAHAQDQPPNDRGEVARLLDNTEPTKIATDREWAKLEKDRKEKEREAAAKARHMREVTGPAMAYWREINEEFKCAFPTWKEVRKRMIADHRDTLHRLRGRDYGDPTNWVESLPYTEIDDLVWEILDETEVSSSTDYEDYRVWLGEYAAHVTECIATTPDKWRR